MLRWRLGNGTVRTHIADVDDFNLVSARGSVVGERVGRNRGRSTTVEASTTGAAATTTTTTSASEAATTTAVAETSAATKSSSSISTTEATSTAAEAAAHGIVGKPVFTDLEHATLPVVAVELLDSIACIVGGFEDDYSRTFRSAVLAEVDIGSEDTSGPS
jgi:hypothetical protein